MNRRPGGSTAGRLAETGALVDAHFDTARPHVVAIFGKARLGQVVHDGRDAGELLPREHETSIGSVARDTAVLLLDTLGIFQWTDIALGEGSDSTVLRNQRARPGAAGT